MKALIVDFTAKNEVKILNARITSGVTVQSAFYLSIGEGEDAVAAAITRIKKEKLSDIPAFIIPSRDWMQTQLFHFPPMPDRDIEKILPREIASGKDSNEPVIFSYIRNGSVMEKGQEKIEVAVFSTNKKNTFILLDRMKQEGLNPVKLIPEAQGLKTLVEMNPDLTTEKTGVMFLELLDRRVCLNIFKFRYWGLDREFVYKFEVSDELADDDLSRISVELNRTFQYFKQRNRNYTVEKVILYGNHASLPHLKQFLEDNHPVSADLFQPEHLGAKITFPPHLQDTGEFVRIFTLAISVAVSMSSKKVLNLLPDEYREQEKMPRRLIGLGVSTALIVAILMGGVFYFEKIKSSYEHDIQNIRGTVQKLERNAATIEKTKQERAEYFKIRSFTEFPVQYAFAAADFLRRLSLASNESIQLAKMEIRPRSKDFIFKLQGGIDARDNIDAQARFLLFYQELKNFINMAEINFSTIKVNADSEKPLSPPSQASQDPLSGGVGAGGRVKLIFTIEGKVEME